LPSTGPSWRLRAVDEDASRELAAKLRLHPVLARTLCARGLGGEEAARRFLAPRLADLLPPSTMAGIDSAVERIGRALLAEERIGVFGDYDVDGVSSTALLGDYLRRAGAHGHLRVARRDEGYGFQVAQAEELVRARCTLLVLVDCGTGDLPAVEAATRAGIDVIAVDHHRVSRWDWPGLVLLNPQRPDCNHPYKGHAAVGLVFYLVASLRRYLERAGRQAPDPREFLDLVALGTVADVAPLDGENRILVARGLQQIGVTTRPGLRELLRLANVVGRAPTSEEVAWRLGPRLNAPGRMGDARVSLDCLFATDPRKGALAARQCDSINERRKELQNRIFGEALEQAQRQVDEGLAMILVGRPGWHPGVIGIVASKLCETFARPSGVLAIEETVARGSARSVAGVDLFAVLSASAELLERFGGHRAAGGFSVRPDRIDALRKRMHEVVAPVLEGLDARLLELDAILPLDQVDLWLCRALRPLAPHGHGNREPAFAALDVRVESARVVGTDHLALVLRAGQGTLPSIAFGMAGSLPVAGERVDVAFTPEIDDYQGAQGVRLRVLDLRNPTDPALAARLASG
jgi:single-stranded-DNA-specific exonuclease